MKLDDRALPLTRRQPDICAAQETSLSGTEWRLRLFARIENMVDRNLLERSISKVAQGAVQCGTAFFQADGRDFQNAIAYPNVELDFYGLRDSRDSVREAREKAASIQLTPTPFSGSLFKFALIRTRPAEDSWFTCCHRIITDRLGVGLVGRRLQLSTLQPTNWNRRHHDLPTLRPRSYRSKMRWPDQAVPTCKSNSNAPTERPDEKAVSGCG